jgi:hypothetical protein
MAKELKFKCPECGCTELISIETSKEIYFVKSISDDPIEPIIYHEKTETIDHWKDRFQCEKCNFAFELSEEDMVKWIKNVCPQE